MSTAGDDDPLPLSEAPPDELLQRFSEKWNVADDVAEATLLGEEKETAIRHEHTYLNVDESVARNARLPESTYQKAVSNRRRLGRRYDGSIPDEDATVRFIEYGKESEVCSDCSGHGEVTCETCDGDMYITCPTCRGSFEEQCSDCRGSGTEQCGRCMGDGWLGHGEDEERCRDCDGSGEVDCDRCEGYGSHTCRECLGDGEVECDECYGTGYVTCSVCDGEGRTVTATKGTIKFSYVNETTYTTEYVPEKHIPDDAGSRVGHEVPISGNTPSLGDDCVYRHDVVNYAVEARTVGYEHGGDRYQFYQVEDTLSADEYPKSIARRLAAIGGVVTLGGVAVAVAWHMGYITF